MPISWIVIFFLALCLLGIIIYNLKNSSRMIILTDVDKSLSIEKEALRIEKNDVCDKIPEKDYSEEKSEEDNCVIEETVEIPEENVIKPREHVITCKVVKIRKK